MENNKTKSTRHKTRNKVNTQIVGDCNVGKSSLISAYIPNASTNSDESSPNNESPAMKSKLVSCEGKTFKLCIYDRGMAEEDWKFIDSSYQNADVILICFSLIDPSSLESVTERWVPDIKAVASKTPIILVGMKSDLRDEPNLKTSTLFEPISTEKGETISKEIEAFGYIECSSKTKYNINEVFELSLQSYVKNLELQKSTPKEEENETCIIF
ncbi:rho-related GTP-binding protein RhoU [Histomonas meleagridis]|uniref:rho-related GTP-binding protein RhoU n=1 Tax=Histomonas meleagridis TaxID=135588 RepID=UPI0035597526|nr:rho-related GTP-binding protein RhoU [Histomonas meleagridis]KAH0799318.1 rho-related GTP-binding protein RhoU [Histomonas meleagridis]